MSPGFGFLGRTPSIRYSSLENYTSNLGLDAKSPLLSDFDKNFLKEDLDRISIARSSISKASFHTGELPIAHGCSLTQTIFNGKP